MGRQGATAHTHRGCRAPEPRKRAQRRGRRAPDRRYPGVARRIREGMAQQAEGPTTPPPPPPRDAGFSARPLFLPGHERSVKASSRPLPGHSAATWSCWGSEPNGAAVLSLRRRRISHSCATTPIGGRCRRHCLLAFRLPGSLQSRLFSCWRCASRCLRATRSLSSRPGAEWLRFGGIFACRS